MYLYDLKFHFVRVAAFILVFLSLYSCRKESFTTDPSFYLRVAADTLHFDTVFTTTGSVTQVFKVFNDNPKGIQISKLELKGGAQSPFRLNVNGLPGYSFQDIAIAGNDSAYVFASVKIDPTAANLPFVVRDSVEILYNGNRAVVQLEAYGRNARFIRKKVITADETWTNELPYVILGGLEVAQGATLTIEKGSRIYLHADAPMLVKGTLKAAGGDSSSRILFTGDRLDEPYRDHTSGWPGIFFTGTSKDNILEYVVVKNSYQGVIVQSPAVNSSPKLRLKQVIIDNVADAGLLAVNTSVIAENVLISNCGKNLMLVSGGDYQFTHCTIATIANRFIQHKEPVVLVSNYMEQAPAANSLNAVFRNCIIWGEGGLVDNEVAVLKNGGNTFNVSFDHVLWKTTAIPAEVTIKNAINNQSPLFDSINTTRNFCSFRLKAGSPAKDKGVSTSISVDLDGKPRPVGLPDLGAYENQ